MLEQPSPKETLEKTIDVLSKVTNQSSNLQYTPEFFKEKLDDVLPFYAVLNFGEEYNVRLWHILKKDRDENCWDADYLGHILRDNNKKVLSEGFWSSSESYELSEILEDKKIIDRARINFLLKQLGGISVEYPSFMDYESHTLDSLNGDESYFNSIYLSIMCSLKEKGVKLPPILSKKEHIREAMHEGDVKTLDAFLSEELAEVKSCFESRMLFHSEFEAEKIRQFTLEMQQYHDKSVPLVEKFSDWDPIIIPGKNSKRKYNVLVVEDFGNPLLMEDRLGTINKLSKKLAEEMASTGKYAGTNIFATMNLSQGMDICGTGQIDAILMDGGYYGLTEAQKFLEPNGGALV